MGRSTKPAGLGVSGWTGLGLIAALLAGCDDPKTLTSLRPEGPPEVLQVLVWERVTIDGRDSTRQQLAYGDHPDIDRDTDDRRVTNALPTPTLQQSLRVVLDELVVGNSLEEISCADGTWSRVPIGADPDDLAACAGSRDVIRETCKTDVCIGNDGLPVGLLDENDDGAADRLRFIENAVTLTCGGMPMPLDINTTYYQPSGNQQIPAEPLGVNGLGPALVLVPSQGLRTGSSCTITFAENVVDKDGNRVCAPAMGEPCTPGDTSGIDFTIDRLRVTGFAPSGRRPSGEVNPNANAQFVIRFNAPLNQDQGGTVAVTANGADVTNLEYVYNPDDRSLVVVRLLDGYVAGADYVVSVSDYQDLFGSAMPQPDVFMFRTETVDLPDAGVDASPPDAAM